MTDGSGTAPDFDVAVSFAGEDREIVEEVVAGLKAHGVKVFYDEDEAAELWGQDLVEYFDQVYRVRSRFAIMFVSRHYGEKVWPRHERRSALARGLEQTTPYVLPVRLDDTALEGLRPTTGLLDMRRHGVVGIVNAARTKLAGAGAPVIPPVLDRVPRTELERQKLLANRPDGWEYMLFAGELLRLREEAEAKYRDFKLHYWPSTGESYNEDDVFDFLKSMSDEAVRISSLLEIMTPEAQERAFGPAGEPGDADFILHLANRWHAIYVGFLDWTARLHGATVPEAFREATRILGTFADGPIETYRQHVDESVGECDRIPAALVTGGPVHIVLSWTLEIADEVIEAYGKALNEAVLAS